MEKIKVDDFNCKKCNSFLANLRIEPARTLISVFDNSRKIKYEVFLEDGEYKQWCLKCNTINILRPVAKHRLLQMIS